MSSYTPNDVSQKQVQIAIVGMTGAGKTVLISTLAMKMSQMADKGVFLAPIGDKRRETLRFVQQNWAILNSGQWPSSTPAGELVHLQWELSTLKNIAAVRFADCAGQDIRSLFSQDKIDFSNLSQDLQELYQYFQKANIILFLVNMEDIIGYSSETTTDNILNIDQMISVLTQPTDFPRRCAVVLSQFDKYKPEIDHQYKGNLLEYLRVNLPLLHGQYILKRRFAIIPFAAVEQTNTIVENGQVKKVPTPNFSSYNLQALISWIVKNVDELTPLLPDEPVPVPAQQNHTPQSYPQQAQQPQQAQKPQKPVYPQRPVYPQQPVYPQRPRYPLYPVYPQQPVYQQYEDYDDEEPERRRSSCGGCCSSLFLAIIIFIIFFLVLAIVNQ